MQKQIYLCKGITQYFSQNSKSCPLHWIDIELSPRCVIYGQTCDGADVVVPLTQGCKLPILEVGDWIYFEDMGAYTNSTGTFFNGFPMATTHHVFSASTNFDFGKLPKDFPTLKYIHT